MVASSSPLMIVDDYEMEMDITVTCTEYDTTMCKVDCAVSPSLPSPPSPLSAALLIGPPLSRARHPRLIPLMSFLS